MDPVTIFVGAAVSVIVQVVKKVAGTSSFWNAAILVGLSLVSGAGLYFLKSYGLWDAVLQVLVYAGATYGLIVKNASDVATYYIATSSK